MVQKINSNKKRHGAAMFIVIASVFIFTMLAFLGLQLTNRDNLLSGDLLEVKSQRVSAVAGLNLAISQITLNPALTVEMLQKFQDDENLKWINLSNNKQLELVASEPDWFYLQNSSTTGVATKVKVLGVGAEVVNGTLPVVLHAYGQGRNGEVFEVQGTYGIRGLSTPNVNLTNGPDQAFLARGGFGHLNSAIESDAGVYIGGAVGKDMLIQGPLVDNIPNVKVKKLKVNGDLSINSKLEFTGNIYVNGNITTNSSCDAVFQDNVVVNGGIGGSLTGTFRARKSFYLFGNYAAAPEPASTNANITVDENFWVRNLVWKNNGQTTVGVDGKESIVRFDRGINLASAENSRLNVFGNIDVGGGKSVLAGYLNVSGDVNFHNSTSALNHMEIQNADIRVGRNAFFSGDITGETNDNFVVGGSLYVFRDVDIDKAKVFAVGGDFYVGNALSFALINGVPFKISGRSLVRGPATFSTVNGVFEGNSRFDQRIYSANNSTITFQGKSILSNGIFATPSDVFTYNFNGDSWWSRNPLNRWNAGKANFQGNLSLNGDVPNSFVNKQLNNQDSKSWSFNPDKIFYANTELTQAKFPGFAFESGKAPGMYRLSRVDVPQNEFFGENLAFPEYQVKSVAVLDASERALIDMGFDQEQLATDPALNPASDVFLNRMTTTKKNILRDSKWSKVYLKHRVTQKLNRWDNNQAPDAADAPTGEQLKRIYDVESKNTSSDGIMYGKFLVITIENDDFKYFSNIASNPGKKIPSGVNILWNIRLNGTPESDWNINHSWYSSDEGTVQIVYSTSTLKGFGWTGNFYGFIYMSGANPGNMESDPNNPSVLWGSWEIANSNAEYKNANSGAGFKFWRKKDPSIKAIDVIKESFSSLTPSELDAVKKDPTRDPRVIIFNGDRNLNNIKFEVKMKPTQGWIQVDRWGEYR